MNAFARYPKTAASPALAERFRAGEEQAFAEVYRHCARAMFSTAWHLLGDRELAAEAVQQSFVKAWQARRRFDPDRDLRAWLYAITRRTAIDVYRSNRRAREEVPLDGVPEAMLTAPPPGLDRIWRIQQVRLALRGLEPEEREVLRLAHFHRMTQREIALRLGIPLGTVKSRTARAHRRIGELLSHLADPEPAVPRKPPLARSAVPPAIAGGRHAA